MPKNVQLTKQEADYLRGLTQNALMPHEGPKDSKLRGSIFYKVNELFKKKERQPFRNGKVCVSYSSLLSIDDDDVDDIPF